MTDRPDNTGHIISADGRKIFYRIYQADPERGRLVIAHGLGEHSGRYGHVVDELGPLGLSIWAPDHRGHGQSDGKRGHVDSFSQYLDDLKQVIDVADRGRPDDVPIFLLGHSMGGLIALNYVIREPGPLKGVIASSPGLGMIIEVPALKSALGKIMSSIWPGLSMGNELDSSKISHDQAEVKAYRNDPLVHNRVTARWFTEFMTAMTEANDGASKITIPILMQIAGDDCLVNAQSSKAFFERLTVEDKTLFINEGFYHENYNETPDRRAKALADLSAWIEARL